MSTLISLFQLLCMFGCFFYLRRIFRFKTDKKSPDYTIK